LKISANQKQEFPLEAMFVLSEQENRIPHFVLIQKINHGHHGNFFIPNILDTNNGCEIIYNDFSFQFNQTKNMAAMENSWL
jgi:hypothetical protein